MIRILHDLRPPALALALLLCTAGSPRADFSSEPPYGGPASHFAEYEQQYAATTPAVVLYDRQRTEIHFSMELFTRQYRDLMFAVFDARSASDALDHSFLIPRGTKVKSLKAWSYTPGAAGLVWSKDSDMRTSKLAFGARDVRVAVPGLAGKGLCGVRLELEWDGMNYISAEFDQPYPIRLAEATVSVQQVGNTNYGASPAALVSQIFAWMIRGESVLEHTEVDDTPPEPVQGKYGPEWRWTFKDLPAHRPEPLARAQATDPIGFYLVPRGFNWNGTQTAGPLIIGPRKLPAAYLKSERAGLAGLAPAVVVAQVTRLLDDPGHFRLLGRARGLLYQNSLSFTPRADGRIEGTALDKAILANLLLTEAGVTSYFAFGASRYRESLDLKIPRYTQFDAILLRIPVLGPNYLWDVADRRVPLGVPGPELYTLFLVLDPDADDAVALFEPPAGQVTESRHIRVERVDAQGFRGSLRWRTSGPPTFDAEPWDDDEELTTRLNEQWGGHVKVDSALWQTRGSDFRAGENARAELTGSLRGSATATGSELLELQLDLPGLPAELVAATESPARRHALYFARGYDFADTISVDLSGARWSGPRDPIELKTPAGRFSLKLDESPTGLTLVRHLELSARETAAADYELCRSLVQAWRRSEMEPLAIRPAGR